MYGYGKDKAMLELHEAIYVREKQNISMVQVDEYLNSHHYSDDRLRIQRLSGENLDMAKCYINLAVVRHMPLNNTAPSNEEASPFDIFSRLGVDSRDANQCVDLAKMFDSRHTSQGLMKAPRRILIRGRAGVGKTTLCKKMVFEFERRNLWNDLFERVLWVPLRTLKTLSRDSLTLVDFFHYHFFRDDHRFGHILAERLAAEVQPRPGMSTGSRTLLILDGLDEVTETWNIDEPMHDLLAKLLNQPNVIITSRPHAQLPLDVENPIDLELETVGFQLKQVDEYLEMALPSPKDVKEIQNFLKRFAIVQGLARIPILLDALCYIWSDNAGNNPILQTMTNFYKYVQQQLMIKDSVRLGKRKASVAHNMGPLQLEDCFKDEVELLEKLAFTGMVNDMIEFEPKTRHFFLRAFKNENDRILPDQSIRHLSFLRTSDPHKKGADVNYHFLHLTFQEFFAASCFVRQWISNSENSVCYLDLKHDTGKEQETISSFLAQHKYNPRYDIFWRFVAGLLDNEQNGDEVENFFRR
uniref:NACHT domain-containing protein n=1 Tax=Bionectria ochroleuca TaxID=29856 RepID=A0A8H7N3H9_BIOOC